MKKYYLIDTEQNNSVQYITLKTIVDFFNSTNPPDRCTKRNVDLRAFSDEMKDIGKVFVIEDIP